MYDFELLYFPARGRAEQIRLMFALQGLTLHENPASNWPELKPTTPFGLLPVFTERCDHAAPRASLREVRPQPARARDGRRARRLRGRLAHELHRGRVRGDARD